MDIANTSHDTNNSGSKDPKRQQFTNKQRMDMYAFCVLELEMHSNKVSIKKQQQAIQKVLFEQQKEGHQKQQQQQQQQDQQQPQQQHQPQHDSSQLQQFSHLTPPPPSLPPLPSQAPPISQPTDQQPSQQQQHQQQQSHTLTAPVIQVQQLQQNGETSQLLVTEANNGNSSGVEGKTLLQLQQEVAMSRKCYSDYQKTQVLTSSMLRDVQKRFAKYYPDSAIPSRTTIKHVFEKCVAYGTVENIRTPRKATKLPQGDQIEHLLIHEPQLSLRQLAQKLNVSTGTVSRRCKALGLVPESVTIKHQQLATARRQKQLKQLENQSRGEMSTASNGNHESKLEPSGFD